MLGPGAAKFPPFAPLPGSPAALAGSVGSDVKLSGFGDSLKQTLCVDSRFIIAGPGLLRMAAAEPESNPSEVKQVYDTFLDPPVRFA